jgi:AcrR family transcriptional regulator
LGKRGKGVVDVIITKRSSAAKWHAAPVVKVALVPKRSNGRERVALILRAAFDVVHERGYEGITMKDIADRSGTKVGSLYRFFPTKELLGDALIDLYSESFGTFWHDLIARAPLVSTEQLSDLLLNAFIQNPERYKALASLLVTRVDCSTRRQRIRIQHIKWIAEALKAHAPRLTLPEAKKIGVVMLYSMRAIMNMTFDPTAANAPGAIGEVRLSARSYLVSRIGEKI